MGHELLDLVDRVEPDDAEGYLQIQSFELDASQSKLSLALDLVEESSDIRDRRILECANPYRWLLTERECTRALVTSVHPAVLPFADRRCELTFQGTPDRPVELANTLRASHAEYVGSYIDFDSITNQPLAELLAGGFGQIASGPASLLERFKLVADEAGLVTTLTDCGPPGAWVIDREWGETWKEIREPPSVLDFGESFVVAERFSVTAS